MSAAEALKAAIDLFHLPSQVRVVRSLPLPTGTDFLLRLASGEARAAREAEIHSHRGANASRAAAIFFIEQILLSPESDEYRILGLDHTATTAELRAHMALLLKWLHPDLAADEHKSLMARRVIEAWNKVKSSDRRLSRNCVSSHPDTMPPAFPQPQSTAGVHGRRDRELTRRDSLKKEFSAPGIHHSTRPANRLRKLFAYVFRRSIIHYKN